MEAVVSHPGHAVLPAAQAGGVDLARLTLTVIGPPMAQIVIRPAQPSAVEIRVVTRSGHYRDIHCGFLGRSGDLVELSCSVDLGWSGAPVVPGWGSRRHFERTRSDTIRRYRSGGRRYAAPDLLTSSVLHYHPL